MLEEMQSRFKESMRFIYPDGVDSPAQYRDLVRVYFMGWFDVMMVNNLRELGAKYIETYEPIAQPGWWPDDSWKWW